MKTIIVTERRSGVFHARLKGNPEVWAEGESSASAIGYMIETYPEAFEIEVEEREEK